MSTAAACATDASLSPCVTRGKHDILPHETKGEWFGMGKTRLELFRGTLDILILKSLIWGPLHGYAITSFIRHQSDDVLLVEEGTLYPALWRLESKGFVEAEWGLSDNNRKAKYYSLTNEGRRHFRLESKSWEAYTLAVAKVLGAPQPHRQETA
jgi:PadR family transcriptional regulator PadR